MHYYNTLIQPTNYILVTDAATEPLTLAEVKTFLRIDTTDYDAILTPLIKTARQLCEKITGRDMINKTWKTYLDNFSCGYYPNYYPNIYLKKGESFPSVDDRKQSVEIIFVSGYGVDATFVPQALKDGMLNHIASMYSDPGGCNDCDSTLYKSFYSPYIISKLLFSII